LLDQIGLDPSLVVFAIIAVFVVWKLRSVLGVRIDRGPTARNRFPPPGASLAKQSGPQPGAEPVADRWKGLAEPGSKSWSGLDAIAAADPAFSGTGFVQGARKAYEAVVVAFAKGDRKTLRNLLSKDVFENFAADIAGREQRGETVETAVISIDSATIDDARAAPKSTHITVRFTSKLMTSRQNRAGELIEGSLDRAVENVDLWTFARDPRSRDPNWKLVATETVH
jgi:predicted lipid-binding transport protein (Tim44 family)